MRPNCLKCIILCMENLFSSFEAPLKDFLGELRLSQKFYGAFLSHPKVLAALMALNENTKTQKILGDDFPLPKFLEERFYKQ